MTEKRYYESHITMQTAGSVCTNPTPRLPAAARQLHDAGCQVVRKKIELVVFDEKVG